MCKVRCGYKEGHELSCLRKWVWWFTYYCGFVCLFYVSGHCLFYLFLILALRGKGGMRPGLSVENQLKCSVVRRK